MIESVNIQLGGRNLILETGRYARQAAGSVLARYADTVVLAAVVAEKVGKPDRDFFPLTVDYREKMYAAGRIPGGFFKREGRPTEKEILCARLTDRSVRPLFPDGFNAEVQVYINVLSHDTENDSDVLGLLAGALALNLSDVPFPGPVAAVRVGKKGGSLVINPTISDQEECTLNMVVAGTETSILMVEGGGRQNSEAEVLEALRFAHDSIREICQAQKPLIARAGKTKRPLVLVTLPENITQEVESRFGKALREANVIPDKHEREEAISAVQTEALLAFTETHPDNLGDVKKVMEKIEKEHLRNRILEQGVRADGRGLDDVRQITCEVGILPRTHGSAVFTRGQTQALVVTTLGTGSDEQRLDQLEGETWKSFLLHYNFPSYSVGEVRPVRGPGRREIGHGKLAERAIESVIPSEEAFPYTIRLVSDILESNGSSSMATVCGGSLALMDAGVPIQSHVAGIAMGLIEGEAKTAVITDILGVEDHLGDMDFKVAGTRRGITSVQMDIKLKRGLDFSILTTALEKARVARMKVLDVMEAAMPTPRAQLSSFAPRITVLTINPDKIREVIGPGGKVIRKIQEDTGATIDIEDDGTIKVAAYDSEGGARAVEIIRGLTEDPEVGAVYDGIVRRIQSFGAFVEILPNRDGLLHISELDTKRVERVEDVVREGDRVRVKVLSVDPEGKVRLSRKALLVEQK
jgi:polyribonucleotide nucleotidyltransferase